MHVLKGPNVGDGEGHMLVAAGREPQDLFFFLRTKWMNTQTVPHRVHSCSGLCNKAGHLERMLILKNALLCLLQVSNYVNIFQLIRTYPKNPGEERWCRCRNEPVNVRPGCWRSRCRNWCLTNLFLRGCSCRTGGNGIGRSSLFFLVFHCSYCAVLHFIFTVWPLSPARARFWASAHPEQTLWR